MMNKEHTETLLMEYLLHHRPEPFRNLVAAGEGPTGTCYLVFREHGTLNDLVIAIKFIPAELRSDQKDVHWEDALLLGTQWRRQMRRYKSDLKGSTWNLPSSLIITATFSNRFGLELVGHVEESTMTNVEFRLPPAMVSCSATLQYKTILGILPIYRWEADNQEPRSNVIGFILPEGRHGAKKDIATALGQVRSSLTSLATIVKRNKRNEVLRYNSIPKGTVVNSLAGPPSIWSTSVREVSNDKAWFSALSSLQIRGGNWSSSTPPNATTSNLKSTSTDDFATENVNSIVEFVFNAEEEELLNKTSDIKVVSKVADSILEDYRDDVPTYVEEMEETNTTHEPFNNDDIAINLLCPYQQSSSKVFKICYETIEQTNLRQKIEESVYCQHLNGQFVAVRGGNAEWTVQKVECE